MNTQFKHAAAAALAALMLTAVMPFSNAPVKAASKKMVVIGDGAAFGKNLADPSDSFASIAGSQYDVDVVNLAKGSCTTADLLTLLDDPDVVRPALAQADVIVFTVGVQDITDPFMAEAESFKQKTGADFKTLQEMFGLSSRDLAHVPSDSELQAEATALSKALKSNKESGAANILQIGEKLSAYPNAKVICTNVYNPLSLIEEYDGLQGYRKLGYTLIKNAANTTAEDYLNESYKQLAETYGFTVINVYDQFNEVAYKYTGLNTMDYEPNELGHQWIGEQLTAALEGVLPPASDPGAEYAPGDVNNDGSVNSKDANAVLIAAAKLGAGQDSGLDAGAATAADVNHDGVINSKDANCILRFAAAFGAGLNPVMSDYI